MQLMLIDIHAPDGLVGNIIRKESLFKPSDGFIQTSVIVVYRRLCDSSGFRAVEIAKGIHDQLPATMGEV